MGGIPLSFAPQTKPGSFQFCMGGRVRGEEEGASKSLSSLKEIDSSRF